MVVRNMAVRNIIINASPLIVLLKSQQAQLLPQLFQEILVPAAVWQDVMAKPDDLAALQLQKLDWLKRVDNILISPTVAAWDLGMGESEVSSLAHQLSDYGAVIDDRAARNCAKTLNILTLGTGAILTLGETSWLGHNNQTRHPGFTGSWFVSFPEFSTTPPEPSRRRSMIKIYVPSSLISLTANRDRFDRLIP
jgi:predicted nucleic acid-binding protein